MDEDGKRGTVLESATLVHWDDGSTTSEPAYNLTRSPDDWERKT